MSTQDSLRPLSDLSSSPPSQSSWPGEGKGRLSDGSYGQWSYQWSGSGKDCRPQEPVSDTDGAGAGASPLAGVAVVRTTGHKSQSLTRMRKGRYAMHLETPEPGNTAGALPGHAGPCLARSAIQ
eukprot:354739-Chlamydomonas_euryale.AAC.3